mmetsp:Transcript_13228/g.24780  ORF Transcript_13228/g.24780 Transcript_13228/m.24780 type:complete len:347 (-) Transcript_13228:521-1561(-)
MFRVVARSFAKFKPDLTAAEKLSPKGPKYVLEYKEPKPYYHPKRLERLQKLVKLHTVTPGLSVPESVMELAKKDEEFARFLESFKENVEPKHSSLLNSASISREELLEAELKRSAQERLQEMHMYEHYRKAKIVSQVNKKLQGEVKEEDDMEDEFELLGNKRLFPTALFDREQFEMLLLDTDSTTNITRLNRVMKRRVLMFTGNGNGIIGYGIGKGTDYNKAYDAAVKDCLNNLIAIPIDEIKTSLVRLTGSHNGMTMNIDPYKVGYVFGHPIVTSMIELTGITQCRFGLKGRNRSVYSLVYSFFQAVSGNLTSRQFAEITGRKVYELTYGGPSAPQPSRVNTILL